MRYRKTLMWVKLPNSGDNLKLSVLSYILKYISGWTNYSVIVISWLMNENEIEYRGSKSAVSAVKEQRADGNWCIINPQLKLMHLRCALMGFERNYQVKIPSNQLKINYFSTINSIYNLNLWFVVIRNRF